MTYGASSSGLAPPSLSFRLSPLCLASGALASITYHTPYICRIFAPAGFMCLDHLPASPKKKKKKKKHKKALACCQILFFFFACSVSSHLPFLGLKPHVSIWFSSPFCLHIGSVIISPVDLRALSCGLLGQETGVFREQSGILFTFVFIGVVEYSGLKPNSLGSNPDSAIYKLVT